MIKEFGVIEEFGRPWPVAALASTGIPMVIVTVRIMVRVRVRNSAAA